jgi:hypothetical protein
MALRLLIRPVLVALGVAAALASCAADRQPAPSTAFGRQVRALSEPGGYFDTDNLVSNERSYLTVLPALQRLKLHGGAYIGVGPDQNFSYIAELRPAIAFILDIRRDNLLLHLLFKAMFATAPTRVEYLAVLTGRAPPPRPAEWTGRSIDEIVAYIDRARPLDGEARRALEARLVRGIEAFGVPLTSDDRDTVRRFHRRFEDEGLDLRFQTFGRPPQHYYPTLGQLIAETDGAGRQASFLATEARFQVVRGLQEKHLVIPVTGDLGGPSALKAIGEVLRGRGLRLQAFYASNVEFYLYRSGTYDRFLENLASVPHDRDAVIIRSIFGGGGSFSETEPIASVLDRARGDVPVPRIRR